MLYFNLLSFLLNYRVISTYDDVDDSKLFARAHGSDDDTLTLIIAEKIWNFFRSRSLKWKPFTMTDLMISSNEHGNLNIAMTVDTSRLVEVGRGKMKNSGHIIGALIAKVAIVGALIFKGLVLLVGKALLVSKLAFLLSSILALKKLLSKKYVTYEVVAHPAHEHHDHHSAGWGRALDGLIKNFAPDLMDDKTNEQDLAYKGYISN